MFMQIAQDFTLIKTILKLYLLSCIYSTEKAAIYFMVAAIYFLVCQSVLLACLSVNFQWMIQVTRGIQDNS